MNDREALAGVSAWALGLSLAWAMSSSMTFEVKRPQQPLKLTWSSVSAPANEQASPAAPGEVPAPAQKLAQGIGAESLEPPPTSAPAQPGATAPAANPRMPAPLASADPNRVAAVTPLRQDQWRTERPRLQALQPPPSSVAQVTPAQSGALTDSQVSAPVPGHALPPPEAPPEPYVVGAQAAPEPSVSSFASFFRKQVITGNPMAEPKMPPSQTVSSTRIAASQAAPKPGERIAPGTFKLLGVEPPGGEVLVLGVLVNDQGKTEDVVVVVASQYALSDVGLVMGHFRKTWPDLVPPMAPGEKRWLELRIDYEGIDPSATQTLP